MMQANQQPLFCLPEGEVVPKERSRQVTARCGQLSTTSTLPPSTTAVSRKHNSSKLTSPDSQMSLFSPCQYQTSLCGGLLAPISALRGIEPGLRAIAESCFLKASDFYDSSSLVTFCLRTSRESSLTTAAKPSSKSLPRLGRWGIWAPGSSATGIDTSLKTESESSVWVFTGDVQSLAPLPGKKSLKECLQSDGAAIVYRAPGEDRVFTQQAPTLRSLASTNGHQAGSGAVKVREFQGELYRDRPLLPEEAEALMGWEPGCTAKGIDATGNEVTIAATNRHKVLGNGIIPQEITEILSAIKPMVLATRQPLIAYCDEVGYGTCFGPPVVCVVVLRPDCLPRLAAAGVRDSKQLSGKQRQALLQLIGECAIAVRYGYASVDEVNTLNIKQATFLAMRRALDKLPVTPALVRVDGAYTIPGVSIPQQAVQGGDASDVGIAAASILAKEWRDALLVRLDKRYPGYGLARHKGYCVPEHRRAIARLGVTRLHHRNNKFAQEALTNG